MKRWEMVAKALGCKKWEAELLCSSRSFYDPNDDVVIDPAPDLGRDIAAAHIVVAAKGDDDWCDVLMDVWERLTGRKG